MGKNKKKIKEKIFRYGELFCGPGGLSLGAQKAKVNTNGISFKIKHRWATDYDFDSCQTYIKNICPQEPQSIICKNIKYLKIESLKPIDIFAYGFPCNDFSVVGEQKGFKGKYGPLYSYGLKVLDLFKPQIFVAENVSGLASVHDGLAFGEILRDLENAGNRYNVTPHLYKAEEYGVPQTRHRIIIVGIEKRLGLKFKVPAPTHKNRYVAVANALEIPPILAGAYNNEIKRQSEIVSERLRHIKPGQNVWTAKLPKYLRLNVQKAKMSQIYRRLDPNRPSYTITASGGGGTHGYHYSEPRALTNRERARIQTFPDTFIFNGSSESVRKQIGMAVPPVLSKIIFTAILKTFAGVSYRSVEENLENNHNSLL